MKCILMNEVQNDIINHYTRNEPSPTMQKDKYDIMLTMENRQANRAFINTVG